MPSENLERNTDSETVDDRSSQFQQQHTEIDRVIEVPLPPMSPLAKNLLEDLKKLELD